MLSAAKHLLDCARDCSLPLRVTLLLRRLCHFLFHCVIQIFCLQFTQGITWRLEIIRQLLGETVVAGTMAMQVPESPVEELVKG